LDWLPANHTQAEARIEGVERGLPGVGAQIFYLVGKGTIEERMCKIVQERQENLDRTLDGKDSDPTLDVYDLLEEELLKEGW
jgi:hypothetical protein